MNQEEWKRERSYTRKRAFQTREYAVMFARYLGGKFKVYQCNFCREFHLSTVKNAE